MSEQYHVRLTGAIGAYARVDGVARVTRASDGRLLGVVYPKGDAAYYASIPVDDERFERTAERGSIEEVAADVWAACQYAE